MNTAEVVSLRFHPEQLLVFIYIFNFFTFFVFFRSYSFLFAVLWWPVQWAFVAFLVT